MTRCAAGTEVATCSHILTGLVGLRSIQSGLIKAGECGDGDKAWGRTKRSNAVPVQSARNVSLLTHGGARLRAFTGIRCYMPHNFNTPTIF